MKAKISKDYTEEELYQIIEKETGMKRFDIEIEATAKRSRLDNLVSFKSALYLVAKDKIGEFPNDSS
jgi:hypothetical protein